MRKNNFSWYDGWFFKKIIDPNQKKLRVLLERLLPPQSKVIDIACGTGAFSLYLAEKKHSVVGIDLSKSMIKTAQKSLLQKNKEKRKELDTISSDDSCKKSFAENISQLDVQFFQGNAIDLSQFVKKNNKDEKDQKFDYAFITLAIHEMPEEERIAVLKGIKSSIKKLVLSDYIVPRPKGLQGATSYLIEMIAGKNHFSNYRKYMKNGGMPYYLEQAGYKIEKKIIIPNNTISITIAT